jgi:hypothetical protein
MAREAARSIGVRMIAMDVGLFTVTHFRPHVGSRFRLHADDVLDVELVEVDEVGGPSEGARAPFSIVFVGPPEPVRLEQPTWPCVREDEAMPEVRLDRERVPFQTLEHQLPSSRFTRTLPQISDRSCSAHCASSTRVGSAMLLRMSTAPGVAARSTARRSREP